jgi:hypothetical protein
MVDRLTNVEIEDILSSIRRLVSEEARPPLVRQPPKLVLTEADRVDISPQRLAPEDMLEARISELEALLGVPGGTFEPDEGDPFPPVPASPASATPALEAARPVAPVRASPVPTARAAEPEVPEPRPPESEAPESEAPEPEAPEPEAPEPEVIAAAGEPAQADDWIDAPPHEADRIDDGMDVIDEHLLREMVRDILRDELQGALGERITRNVRKLVRAEIARALSSRDL